MTPEQQTLLSWIIGSVIVLIIGYFAVWLTWKFLVVFSLVVRADRNDKKRYQRSLKAMAAPIARSHHSVKQVRSQREPASVPLNSLDADDSIPEDEED
jgi:hypothetical protein